MFPLFPCERKWDVSKGPKVSIVRKGFTLIPDYASTAFMMQGCSLEAAIAECGDEFQAGGLSEMMTTYVILSRVKKADGLLLQRAFFARPVSHGHGSRSLLSTEAATASVSSCQ